MTTETCTVSGRLDVAVVLHTPLHRPVHLAAVFSEFGPSRAAREALDAFDEPDDVLRQERLEHEAEDGVEDHSHEQRKVERARERYQPEYVKHQAGGNEEGV